MVFSKPAFTSMTFLNIETVALAFLVTVIAIPWLINLSNKWKLFDVPEGDALKIHNEHISYLGGAALFLGIMGSAVLLIATLSLYRLELAGFVSAALLLFGLVLCAGYSSKPSSSLLTDSSQRNKLQVPQYLSLGYYLASKKEALKK